MDWNRAVSTAISYPYTIDAYGVVKYTNDINKIYTDRLLTLLSTNIGQRPMLQEYGTDLAGALFENQGNFQAAVNQTIRQAVARWIPDIEISDIKIGDIGQDGNADVTVIVTLPTSTLTSLTVSTSSFNADGTITR
jgi:phage baseplate assembly protein W